jgi:hypothetical protein
MVYPNLWGVKASIVSAVRGSFLRGSALRKFQPGLCGQSSRCVSPVSETDRSSLSWSMVCGHDRLAPGAITHRAAAHPADGPDGDREAARCRRVGAPLRGREGVRLPLYTSVDLLQDGKGVDPRDTEAGRLLPGRVVDLLPPDRAGDLHEMAADPPRGRAGARLRDTVAVHLLDMAAARLPGRAVCRLRGTAAVHRHSRGVLPRGRAVCRLPGTAAGLPRGRAACRLRGRGGGPQVAWAGGLHRGGGAPAGRTSTRWRSYTPSAAAHPPAAAPGPRTGRNR